MKVDVPKCPIHLGSPMKLVKSSEPLFVFVTHTSRGKSRAKEAEDRKIWRCPVAGCSRVESMDRRFVP
jgi:hypothetical protein